MRDRILGRVSSALGPRANRPAPGTPPPLPDRDLPPDELRHEFRTRWTNLGGAFHHVTAAEGLGPVLASIMEPLGGGTAAVSDSALELRGDVAEMVSAAGMRIVSARPADAADAAVGVTGARLALAYSGTIAVSSAFPGDLSGSLLPPVHVALIPADRLVYGVPRAIRLLDDRPRGLALITGPSRTADIELTLVMGVHGPGAVHAVLLDY